MKEQERLIEGQKVIQEEVRGIRSDLRQALEGIKQVLVEMRELRKDFRRMVEERFQRLEEGIARIKAHLGIA